MSDAPAFAAPLGQRRGLDGMRALAVLLVAGVHARPKLVPGGSIGVDVFFVLSGFLITTLLVEELDRNGSMAVGRFYARRALRLLPALLGLIVVVLVWATFVASASTRHNAYMEVLAALSYTRNISWWSHVPGTLLGHTWSLALEEQFYLVWPLVVLLCVRPRRRATALIWVFLAVFVVFGALRVTHHQGPSLILVQRPEALLLGGALALQRREGGGVWHPRWTSLATPAVVVGGAGLVLLGAWNGADTMYSIGYSIAAVLAALLIVGLVSLDGVGASRWASHPWVVRFGQMSYGFYLWHMPVLRWVDDRLVGRSALVRLPVGFGIAFAATWASYRWLEQPALRWKERFAAPSRAESPSTVGRTD
jgi:peptidoglycan/LPS O-acetylase OafA/YrhL